MKETIAELRRLCEAAVESCGPFPLRESITPTMSGNAGIVFEALPALLDRLEELEADRERLLAALRLLEPKDGWEGLEDGNGVEIGTRIQAVLDAARFAKQPESETELSKGGTDG